jgi:hypothetical protein
MKIQNTMIRFALFSSLVVFSMVASSCGNTLVSCSGTFVTVPTSFAIQKITAYELPNASAVLPASFPEDEPLGVYKIAVAGDGHVCEVKPVRSSEGFASTAIVEAIKKWRFAPTLVGDEKKPMLSKSTLFVYAKRNNGAPVLVLPGLKENKQ